MKTITLFLIALAATSNLIAAAAYLDANSIKLAWWDNYGNLDYTKIVYSSNSTIKGVPNNIYTEMFKQGKYFRSISAASIEERRAGLYRDCIMDGNVVSMHNSIAKQLTINVQKPTTRKEMCLLPWIMFSQGLVFGKGIEKPKGYAILERLPNVKPELENVAGVPCHVVYSHTDSNSQQCDVAEWFAADKSMLLMRYHFSVIGKIKPTKIIESYDVNSIGSVNTPKGLLWYPKEVTKVDRNGRIDRYKVYDYSVEPLEKSVFQRGKLPAGTNVINFITGEKTCIGDD
jgi:hypothetical protein